MVLGKTRDFWTFNRYQLLLSHLLKEMALCLIHKEEGKELKNKVFKQERQVMKMGNLFWIDVFLPKSFSRVSETSWKSLVKNKMLLPFLLTRLLRINAITVISQMSTLSTWVYSQLCIQGGKWSLHTCPLVWLDKDLILSSPSGSFEPISIRV